MFHNSQVRSTLDYFLENISEKLSNNDEEKREEMWASDKKNNSNCYIETMKVFTEKCMGPEVNDKVVTGCG